MDLPNAGKFTLEWDQVTGLVAPGKAGIFDPASRSIIAETTPEAAAFITGLQGAALNPETRLVPSGHYSCQFCSAVTPHCEETARHDAGCVYTAGKHLGDLPRPRLQHRWVACGDDPTFTHIAHYELILPFYSDYARDRDKHGFLPVQIMRSRAYIPDGKFKAPRHAGAYSAFDRKIWGDIPVFLITPDYQATSIPA